MSANRILVHSGVATDFRDRFCRKASALTTGDPAEAATVIGPLINARQVAALEKKVGQSGPPAAPHGWPLLSSRWWVVNW